MATINLGAIKFNWKGAYNSSTTYAVDDVVSSGGNSYVCIQAHSNQAVGNATAYWNIMSSAGTNGTNGTDVGTTLTTQGDLLYRDGSGLQRLAKGTAGQVLKINSGANAPEWGTDAGGKIGAVSSTILRTSSVLSANSVWTEISGLNATITPTATGSSFIVMGHLNTGSNAGGPAGHGLKLYRSNNGASNSSIDALTASGVGSRIPAMVTGASEGSVNWSQDNGSFNVLDTPANYGSYSLGHTMKYSMYQYANGNNAVTVNRSMRDDDNDDDTRATCTITIMEVLA